MAPQTLIPQRYIVVLVNLILFIIATGFRATFSMVMTRVSQVNSSIAGENIFPNCTTRGTSRDFQVSWTGEEVSLTHTVYFFGSFLSQVPAGILSIWISPKRVVSFGVFSTSVLYLVLTVSIRSYYGVVMFIRFVQGLLEGTIFPAAYGVLALWAPEATRSRFISIVGSGAYFSPVLSMIVTGAMACYVQWDAALYLYGSLQKSATTNRLGVVISFPKSWKVALFKRQKWNISKIHSLIIFDLVPSTDDDDVIPPLIKTSVSLITWGGIGIVLALAYNFLLYDRPTDNPNLGSEEIELYKNEKITTETRPGIKSIPWRRIFTSMPVYAVLVGSFLRNWVFSLMITEQPEYVKDAFDMNTATIGLLSALPHLMMGTVALSSGFVIDFIMEKKWLNRSKARKLSQTIGSSADSVCFFLLFFVESHQWKLALTLMCVGIGISGFVVSGYEANQLELAPQYTPLITAVSRTGIIGAVLSTAVTGSIAGNSHDMKDWQRVFLISAIVNAVGVVFYDIFAAADTQSWATEESTVLIDDSMHNSTESTGTGYNTLRTM